MTIGPRIDISISVGDDEQGKDLAPFVRVLEGSEAWRRCGVSFNPSQDERVERIKALAAGLMQVIDEEMTALGPSDGDGKRCMATAKTHLEAAQMFAVKGCFMDRDSA